MAGFEHQHLKEMKAGLCELHIQGSSSSAAPCEETSETMTIMGGGGGFCGGPYPDVDKSLRALAGAAEGFGHAAVGGLNGKLYYVTSLEDDGPGTLREGCNSKDPLWIVFKVSGTIPLIQGILVSSNKTIDGRGKHVKITGKSLQLFKCANVIICNLEFEGGTGPDVDGIQLKRGTSHVWIDRCTFSNYADGLIDITLQSSYVTVSRCHFFKHNKTMLIGASPKHIGDRNIRVTIHHCFFDGTRQRHPRVRFGKVHLYNNYTRAWAVYGACASVESQILSQHCVYEAADNKKAFEYYIEKAADRDEKESGSLRSEGDLFLNGAEGHVQDPDSVFKAQDFYEHWTLEPADTDLIKNVSRNAGWQNIADLPSDLTDVNEEEEAEEEEEEAEEEEEEEEEDDDNAI